MTHDVIVIGAGPAGMAAAATAAGLGLKTLLLDEQARPGGQVYRNVSHVSGRVAGLLGQDYAAGAALVRRLAASSAEVRQGVQVWDVTATLQVTALEAGRAIQWHARQLIAATGAMERASPLPGWTLPGVMNAGAAQIALKAGGSIPQGPIVLAGAGPLLLLVACQLLDAGAPVAALVETSPAHARLEALAHLPAAVLRAPRALAKGLRMVRRLRRAGVPWFRAAGDLRVLGADRATGLAFTCAGKQHQVAAATILLHHGVIPNQQLTRLLQVEHAWDDRQLAWRVACDAHGRTTLPRLRVAGDGARILGAEAAAASGELAALGAAHALGRIDTVELRRRSRAPQRTLARAGTLRAFLDALYRPPPWIVAPADEVMVCRCEEVTAGRIREMAALGCAGPNQAKFFSRCGMGPCQGRVCGTPVTQILAASLGRSEDEVGSYRVRSPLQPLALQALAALADDPSEPVQEELT